MIQYYKGAFNLNLLLRFTGSAVYRAMIPGIVAVGFQIWYSYSLQSVTAPEEDPLQHPQAVGTLVGSISLLIVFKANYSYDRHWEAYSSVFQMMSRWQDGVQHMVAYHMQCDHYKDMRPPSFFPYPELNALFLTRDREPLQVKSANKIMRKARSVRKSINYVDDEKKQQLSQRWDIFKQDVMAKSERSVELGDEPEPLRYETRLDGGWGKIHPDPKSGRPTATYFHPLKKADGKGFASTNGGRTPSLYLQELAHLTSLLNAVALSTMRNDIDGAESPLDIYDIGSPWPAEDPDKHVQKGPSLKERLKRIVGADTTPAARTKFNASRPLAVIGGVSDAEIRFLQMARGPSAKTQLAWNWVSEFMIREHKQGCTGTIGDALISRSMQFMGNGMTHYNHARKIMYIPFPFPHAQISAFFILVIVPGVPILMYQYANETWLACVLTFFVVTCLTGLHEVSRELETPFRKPPNDVPACTLQAQFNEALITMYAGYHPDSFFDTSIKDRKVTMPCQPSISPRCKPIKSIAGNYDSVPSSSIPEEEEIIISIKSNDESPPPLCEEPDEEIIHEHPENKAILKLQREIQTHAKEMERLRAELNQKLSEKLAAIDDANGD